MSCPPCCCLRFIPHCNISSKAHSRRVSKCSGPNRTSGRSNREARLAKGSCIAQNVAYFQRSSSSRPSFVRWFDAGSTRKSSGTPQFRSNRRSFDCVDRVGDQLRCSDRDGSASRYPTLATKTKTSRGWGTQRLVISRCLRFSPCLRVRAGPRRSMGRSRCCFVRR
jgi:hypothetical protein